MTVIKVGTSSWADRTLFADQADELHVLFNNCCAGQAQRDAERLAGLLRVGRIPAGADRSSC